VSKLDKEGLDEGCLVTLVKETLRQEGQASGPTRKMTGWTPRRTLSGLIFRELERLLPPALFQLPSFEGCCHLPLPLIPAVLITGLESPPYDP
jgi:hypothetical protein